MKSTSLTLAYILTLVGFSMALPSLTRRNDDHDDFEICIQSIVPCPEECPTTCIYPNLPCPKTHQPKCPEH